MMTEQTRPTRTSPHMVLVQANGGRSAPTKRDASAVRAVSALLGCSPALPHSCAAGPEAFVPTLAMPLFGVDSLDGAWSRLQTVASAPPPRRGLGGDVTPNAAPQPLRIDAME